MFQARGKKWLELLALVAAIALAGDMVSTQGAVRPRTASLP